MDGEDAGLEKLEPWMGARCARWSGHARTSQRRAENQVADQKTGGHKGRPYTRFTSATIASARVPDASALKFTTMR